MNHDETIEYYQMRAGEYDKVYTRDNPGRQTELAKLYESSRRTLSHRRVLDLACGTGYWTRLVSETAASILGIDINPATLIEAEKKRYLCPVNFIRADLFHLPLARQSFNGLLASYVVSHIRRQDFDLLTSTLKFLLEPGSRLFICDNNPVCESKPDIMWDNEHVNSYKRRTLENGREYRILKNYFEREELEKMFNSWGRIENFTFGIYYWSIALEFGR